MTFQLDQVSHGTGVARGVVISSAGGDWMREFQSAGRMAWFHAPNDRHAAPALGAPHSKGEGHPLRPDETRQPTGIRLGAGPGPHSAARGAPVAGDAAATPPMPRPAGHEGARMRGATASPQPPQGAGYLGCAAADKAWMPPAQGEVRTPSTAAPARPRSCAVVFPMHPRAPGAREPVRLHVEESGEGVVLWLGIDGTLETHVQDAARIGAKLRRLLFASGLRVAAMVCNGRPMDVPALSHPKEP